MLWNSFNMAFDYFFQQTAPGGKELIPHQDPCVGPSSALSPSLPILKNEAKWVKRPDQTSVSTGWGLGQMIPLTKWMDVHGWMGRGRFAAPGSVPKHPGVSCTPRWPQHRLSTPRKEKKNISFIKLKAHLKQERSQNKNKINPRGQNKPQLRMRSMFSPGEN